MASSGLGIVVPVPFSGTHPARLDVFSDWGSLAHVVAGFAAGFAPAAYQVAALSVFLGYQVSQVATGEGWTRTGGELIEFAIGLFMAAIFQRVTR